jgi:hypothetical protein
MKNYKSTAVAVLFHIIVLRGELIDCSRAMARAYISAAKRWTACFRHHRWWEIPNVHPTTGEVACGANRLVTIDFTKVRPLVCGPVHRKLYGVTGYEDPNHWCNLALSRRR